MSNLAEGVRKIHLKLYGQAVSYNPQWTQEELNKELNNDVNQATQAILALIEENGFLKLSKKEIEIIEKERKRVEDNKIESNLTEQMDNTYGRF